MTEGSSLFLPHNVSTRLGSKPSRLGGSVRRCARQLSRFGTGPIATPPNPHIRVTFVAPDTRICHVHAAARSPFMGGVTLNAHSPAIAPAA